MKSPYFLLLILCIPLSASAVNIGENTTFNITHTSISVCNFSCSSLTVNSNSIDVDSFSFEVNPTNAGVVINNFSISNDLSFGTTSIIFDNPIWFNCTHPLWIKNDINVYGDNVLLTTLYSPSGTINYHHDNGFAEKRFRFCISEESMFDEITDMLISLIGVLDSIFTIIVTIIPILVALIIATGIVAIITKVLGYIK